jgi:hypothetical protein
MMSGGPEAAARTFLRIMAEPNETEVPKPPPRFILILLIGFIGLPSGIFTGWINRYEYEALNRMLSRPSIEDNGLEYVIFSLLALISACVLCFGRIPRLSLVRGFIAICIVFVGGCLGSVLAELARYMVQQS